MIGVLLCTARVLDCREGQAVEVVLLDGSNQRLRPAFALPFLYRPAPGDILAVVGRRGDRDGSATWVIGLLVARGRSHLAFRGDVTIGGGGDLSLIADGGVKLQAPVIKLQGDCISLVADVQVQRARSSDTVLTGVSDERAGDCSRMVDGEDLQIAARHLTVASGVVKRDSELLQLG